jgi:hypothetical protein
VGASVSLKRLLTEQEPFGPPDQTLISNISDAVDCIEFPNPFLEIIKRRPAIVFGRKGSGKSSVLSVYAGIESLRRKQLPSKLAMKYDVDVVQITSWRQFHDMVRTVARSVPPDSDLAPPVEVVEEFWSEQIWQNIFAHYFDESIRIQPVANEAHLAAANFFKSEKIVSSSREATAVAKKLYEETRRQILDYLEKTEKELIVLFDNIEEYPIQNLIFRSVVAGLLRCLSRFSTMNPRATVVFCFPEEVASEVRQWSSNLLKDFRKSATLRWRPGDLLQIAAHRFRLFVREHDPSFYAAIEDHDFSDREDLRNLYRQMMPTHIVNSLGQQEDSVAYLLRHTQLLPRHIILMLNSIAVRSHDKTGGYRNFDAEQVVVGIREAEKNIAENILSPWRHVHNELLTHVERNFADLPPIFSYGDFHKNSRRFARQLDLDPYNILTILFQIGIVGRIHGESGGGHPERSGYAYGHFYFTTEDHGAFPTSGLYCLHPIFSRYFGSTRDASEDKRVVYPAVPEGISLHELA